jgi:hypothetical protein
MILKKHISKGKNNLSVLFGFGKKIEKITREKQESLVTGIVLAGSLGVL